MKDLEIYIELINTATNAEEAFERYRSIMNKLGYDRVTYTLCTEHPSLDLPRQHGLITNYPEDWMNFYKEQNYIENDLVVKRAMETRKPFYWSELRDDPNVSAKGIQILNQGDEAGVKDGFTFSLCSPTREISGMGLARSVHDEKKDYTLVAAVYLLSVYFYETYRSFLAKPITVSLTAKEKEMLSWAAEGKTDEGIAIIINRSVHTIRFHWNKIFKKLDAHGRIYAVTKAIRLQLILPLYIAPPPRNSSFHRSQNCDLLAITMRTSAFIALTHTKSLFFIVQTMK